MESLEEIKARVEAAVPGAMFAIIWYYRARIGRIIAGAATDPVARRFAINVAIAFLPAAVIGVLFASRIKTHLFKPVPVALAFIVGGLIIFWVEHRHRTKRIQPRIDDLDELVGDISEQSVYGTIDNPLAVATVAR